MILKRQNILPVPAFSWCGNTLLNRIIAGHLPGEHFL